eukprot:2253854-Pyramimonas_sp.AAC.1
MWPHLRFCCLLALLLTNLDLAIAQRTHRDIAAQVIAPHRKRNFQLAFKSPVPPQMLPQLGAVNTNWHIIPSLDPAQTNFRQLSGCSTMRQLFNHFAHLVSMLSTAPVYSLQAEGGLSAPEGMEAGARQGSNGYLPKERACAAQKAECHRDAPTVREGRFVCNYQLCLCRLKQTAWRASIVDIATDFN